MTPSTISSASPAPPLRVLHLGSGNLYGGVETLFRSLACERAACPALEPCFGLVFPGRCADELRAAGTPPAIFGPVQVRYLWQVWQARRRLAAFLRADRPGIVICHMPWTLGLFAPIIREARLTLVFWMHADAASAAQPSRRPWVERWAARHPPDLAIINSGFTARTLPDLFPHRTPPHEVLPIPVPARTAPTPAERLKIRAELGVRENEIIVLQVSRSEPWKGHRLHLEALAKLRSVPGWTAWFAGGAQRPAEAAFLEELRALATRLGIADRVRFLGQRDDVPRLLAAADIFCQPNTGPEPFGIVFVEALYAGLPVVTAAHGGALEILDATCARLVPPADADALAAALRDLIEQPNLRAKLGAAGPAHADALCSPARVLPRLCELLAAHVLKKKPRRRLAVFTYGLPTPGKSRGGITRVAHDLAQGLAQRGHAVTVWSHDDPPTGALYAHRPLPWRRFAENRVGLRLTMGYLGNVLFFLVPRGDAECVIAHGDSLLLPLRWGARRVVRVMHGSAFAEALSARSPWRFLAQLGVYLQEILTGATQPFTVGVSANTRRWNPLVRRVIPNGVDTSLHIPSPYLEKGKTPHPSVLFVGTPDGRKRGAQLVKWFTATVLPRWPEATLTCVGPAGPAAAGVAYRPGVPTEMLVRLYQESWLLASPSIYEGFGLPYLEAMACGTPVLATPNPGSREVLADGQFGVLADDAAFPAALVRLLSDADERARLLAAGLRRGAELSLEKTIDRYEELLEEALRPRRVDDRSAQ
ncbi:MAG: glycosyltransferase family 4 protein [Verrucomicrobia bacterium]|nr:glycosyltransferase family 4 protein [Verrucomicrobiota bacterium]